MGTETVKAPASRPSLNLAADTRTAVIEFLRTDLDIGFTMLEMAETASSVHRAKIFGTLGRAIKVIRSFLDEIKDTYAFSELIARIDDLEQRVTEMIAADRKRGRQGSGIVREPQLLTKDMTVLN